MKLMKLSAHVDSHREPSSSNMCADAIWKLKVIKIPNHPQHCAFDTQMFGVPYGTYLWVHQMLDSGFAKLFGKKHRELMHDPETVEMFRREYGDRIALVVAWHIHLDSPTIYNVVNGRLVRNKKRK